MARRSAPNFWRSSAVMCSMSEKSDGFCRDPVAACTLFFVDVIVVVMVRAVASAEIGHHSENQYDDLQKPPLAAEPILHDGIPEQRDGREDDANDEPEQADASRHEPGREEREQQRAETREKQDN